MRWISGFDCVCGKGRHTSRGLENDLEVFYRERSDGSSVLRIGQFEVIFQSPSSTYEDRLHHRIYRVASR